MLARKFALGPSGRFSHFFRLKQLFLNPLPFRDQFREYDDPADGPLLVIPGPHLPPQPVGVTVRSHKRIFFPPFNRAGQTSLMDVLPLSHFTDFREHVVMVLPDDIPRRQADNPDTSAD